MMENLDINTGSSILDDIIKQVYFKVYFFNDTSVKFLNKIDIKSLNITFDDTFINTESKIILNNKEIVTMYYVKSEGIFNADTNCLLFKYNFGSVEKVIYVKNVLFIFSSADKLYTYDTLTFVVSECCYPPQIEVTGDCKYSNVLLEKTGDGNLISIGGLSTKILKVQK